MSQSDIMAIVRHVLTTAAGALVTDGVLTGSQVQDGVGAVMVLIGLGWSLWQKSRQRAMVVAASNTGAAVQTKA